MRSKLVTHTLHAGLFACLAIPAAQAQTPARTPAQAQTPAEIGNRANGLDYQPTQSEVSGREQGAGVAPTPRRAEDENATVERLNQQLQRAENNDPEVHPNGAGKVDPNR